MMEICSQALRHLSRLITPSKLDEWGISYSLDYIRPGEAMFTLPRALHQVINIKTNYAIATNILYQTSNAIPSSYRFCSRSLCPNSYEPHSLTKANFQLQRQIQLVEAGEGTCPSVSKPPAVQPHGNKRKAAFLETQPKKVQHPPYIIDLVYAICGKEAFNRLNALIYSYRDRWRSFDFSKASGSLTRLVNLIHLAESQLQLAQVLSRVAKVELSEIIDGAKAGRIKADPKNIANLLIELNWEVTPRNRKKLHDYLREGRQWREIRGSLAGLLCLIPTAGEGWKIGSGRAYYDLSDDGIQHFHSLLNSNEYILSLRRIAQILESSISKNVEAPQFKWESENPQKIEQFSMRELVPLMEEFIVIEASVCNFRKYHWPQPDCWPWEWPHDPNWIAPSEIQC